jgi:hypothetical protein
MASKKSTKKLKKAKKLQPTRPLSVVYQKGGDRPAES